MKKNILLLTSTLLFCTSALSQNWYIDGGASLVKLNNSIDTASPTNIYVRGGYKFNQHFNAGMESSTTISSDQFSNFPGTDHYISTVSLYVRGLLPISNSVQLYAQVGSTSTKVTIEYSGTERKESINDNDISFGFGAEINLGTPKTYLTISYSGYNNNDRVDVSAINLGVGARF